MDAAVSMAAVASTAVGAGAAGDGVVGDGDAAAGDSASDTPSGTGLRTGIARGGITTTRPTTFTRIPTNQIANWWVLMGAPFLARSLREKWDYLRIFPSSTKKRRALLRRDRRWDVARAEHDIIDQPRAPHIRRNSHERTPRNILHGIKRLHIDNLEIIKPH